MANDLAVEITAALCRRFEGCRLKPYLCPGGVPTIGYGATYYENGVRVTLFDPPITVERAESLLLWMVRTQYMPIALRQCPGLIRETPGRLAAIIDFGFNLGEGNLKASTLRRKVNLGEWEEVPAQLLRWNKAGGKVQRGLTFRRQAEAALV